MKRARYVGASGTGVDLTVTLPDGQRRNVHVDHGDLTPETVAEQPFPEEVVDSLCEQDHWLLEEKPLAELQIAELELRAKALGLTITGTGANGRVIKEDLVAALTAAADTTTDEPADDGGSEE